MNALQMARRLIPKKINKHLADIVQLSALLVPSQTIDTPEKIKTDLQAFVKAVTALNRPDLLQAMRSIAKALPRLMP
jgi:hypothetical protein